MKTVAEQLASKTEVQTATFDFESTDDYREYEKLCQTITEQCGAANISMLVNNVEKMDPNGERFQDSSDEDLIKLLNINSFPITFMTRFLGPVMKAREDKKSAIINTTSILSSYHSQYLPIYSSVKDF